MYITSFNSPVGVLTLLSDGQNLTGLWIEGQKHYGVYLSGTETKTDDLPVFKMAKKWLTMYFDGKIPDFDMPVKFSGGTAFQQKVWQALMTIAYGKTVSYADIAKKISTLSARAVGGAVGRNPISIIVPCHRVIGKNGSLTGFAGGIDKKKILLALEKTDKVCVCDCSR